MEEDLKSGSVCVCQVHTGHFVQTLGSVLARAAFRETGLGVSCVSPCALLAHLGYLGINGLVMYTCFLLLLYTSHFQIFALPLR